MSTEVVEDIKANRRTIGEYMDRTEELALELRGSDPADYPTADQRNKIVDEIIEEHIVVTGRKPTQKALSMLTDFILLPDLKNPHPDKVTNTEYPVLSSPQTKRRMRKEVAMAAGQMDYVNAKFVKRMDSLAKRKTQEVSI